jgi:multidrug resistance protein
MLSPAIILIMGEFHSQNQSLAAFVVSVYVLGFALGPMVLAPLSEMYGRWHIYLLCDVVHIAFTVACAKAPNLWSLILFRFFAGSFGGGPIAIGGGTLTDLFRDDEQALPLGLYSLGPIVGPALGPVIGGYLSQAKGWRWIFWLIAIAVSRSPTFQI